MPLHRLTALALAGVLALGVSACGDDSTPTTAPSTTPATASPSTTEPAAPVLPELASEKSAKGARAFLEYWLGVVTYSMQTGDTDLLAEISAPECKGCNNLIGMIDSIYDKGGRNDGGGWFPDEIARDSRVEMPHQRFLVSVKQPAQSLYDENGKKVSQDPAKRFALWESQVWRSGRWYAFESVNAFDMGRK